MDRGVIHKSSSLVRETMGEGHGWWSMNNLRPPSFEQNSPFLLSTTSSSSPPPPSPYPSFSSLLSSHFPLPATNIPWHDNNQPLPESWSQLLLGGLVGEERYSSSTPQHKRMDNWEAQGSLHPTLGVKQESYEGSTHIYSSTTSHGSDEIQVPKTPWTHTLQASSPRSCITSSLTSNMMEFSNCSSECISTASGAAFKKARIQGPSPAQSTTTVKVRKEKLGDRITALHQLVSPFGKTDTASVLLEAIGYIRFLHGQIEALSSPHLGRNSAGGGGNTCRQPESAQGERNCIFPEDPGQLLHDNAMKKRGPPDQLQDGRAEPRKDLRSRGLCLVPVSCTMDIGSEITGTDYWAQAFGAGFGAR